MAGFTVMTVFPVIPVFSVMAVFPVITVMAVFPVMPVFSVMPVFPVMTVITVLDGSVSSATQSDINSWPLWWPWSNQKQNPASQSPLLLIFRANCEQDDHCVCMYNNMCVSVSISVGNSIRKGLNLILIDGKEQGAYSHIYLMEHVTCTKIDELIQDFENQEHFHSRIYSTQRLQGRCRISGC